MAQYCRLMSEHHDALTKEQVRKLKAAIEDRGLSVVANEMGIGRETLARLVGGSPVRNGSVAVARAHITKVKS
jgi:DNA-binding phage protein